MYRELNKLHTKDWSLNLEDPYYDTHRDELLKEALEAIEQTANGCYVNVVTPDTVGDPQEWLIPALQEQIRAQGREPERMEFIDQCGCGGYVTRVYR